MIVFRMSCLFLCLSLMLIVVHSEPYNCSNKYMPSNYRGFLRVPTNCSAITPSYCPRSWKAGVPEGRSTDKPLIYSKFITCHEGFASCGYVPIDPKTGLVLGKSGVTIGAGVDLGSKSKNSSVFRDVSSSLITQLEPYFGLRKNVSACAAIERPLHLSLSEATNLTNTVTEKIAEEVGERYDADKTTNATAFVSLPRGIRTAIVSVWFQFGKPEAYPIFWNAIKKNDWTGAVKELRNFYKNPDKQLKGDLKRRNDEADIIEASFLKCDRSLDAVFLLDGSGSITDANFAESLNFVKNLTSAFPDEKLRSDDGTRFGLSTFSFDAREHFYLSSYTSKSQYQEAIDKVVPKGSGTHLGEALNRTLVQQFTQQRGLRGEERGIPRILIVLTDGSSYDEVKYSAQYIRSKNIVIYAIGIGNYNLTQLEEVASSPSHVYTLAAFTELKTFVTTLTAATCHEPQPISLDKTINTTTTKNTYKYFLYYVNKNLNLKISVIDLAGVTVIYMSRSNSHPYQYDSDLSFSISSQKVKTLVLTATKRNSIEKRSSGEDDMVAIYVSVTTNSDYASFTIEGSACNPLNCTSGTYEVVKPTEMVSTATPTPSSGQSFHKKCSPVIFLMVILQSSLYFCF